MYRSDSREYTYLYLADTLRFEELPESLQALFGDPETVIRLDLDERETLANADVDTVRRSLVENGYFLQLPPETAVDELLDRKFS